MSVRRTACGVTRFYSRKGALPSTVRRLVYRLHQSKQGTVAYREGPALIVALVVSAWRMSTELLLRRGTDGATRGTHPWSPPRTASPALAGIPPRGRRAVTALERQGWTYASLAVAREATARRGSRDSSDQYVSYVYQRC
jgi:hypothetical protein